MRYAGRMRDGHKEGGNNLEDASAVWRGVTSQPVYSK